MSKLEVLFFDVLGTVVDWRGSIAAEVEYFLARNNIHHINATVFADAWVGRYDVAVEAVRSHARPFVSLDIINMENLEACFQKFQVKSVDLPSDELQSLNKAWHRLKPWPDSCDAIALLKEKFIVAPLSDGHTRLLINMAKSAGLPWDTVFGADIPRTYKPVPDVYAKACALMDISPDRAMLVAAHDYDLEAAKRSGLKTAYVERKNGQDPSKVKSNNLNPDWDYKVSSLTELANLLCQN